MGLGLVYISIDAILAYFETGTISFQLKPTLPRFYGNEALMMTAVQLIVGLIFVLLGYTYVRKDYKAPKA
ncbi:hypothetical protein [Sulfurimonas microaerophilic]|uniref:hypothetical protein n=1 Tax=Sulfurimonas microaerophilic TaxID=3058392 RepID=UPI00271542B7|nr:hypothetical protein [Sulfurimonas sp. hsl 1-7]